MEAIIYRLRELEAEEVQMLKDHKALLMKQTQENERRVRERAAEDEAWQYRLGNRDREEDASHALRQQRRELSRASLADVSFMASIAVCQDAKTEEIFTFRPTNDTESTVITPKFDVSATMKKAKKPRAKETKPRARKPKNVMQSWGTYDSRGRSLYLRPSDGELVYLECCVAGCGKTNFKNIRSIMCHVSDMRIHGGGKGFFRDHAHVIEVCGKLPPERQALREGEEGQRLIEPYPHQEQIAYGSEPSIPVSSLRQSATTHAIEQDFAGLSSPEAPSIRGPPISDYSSVSATPTMETHDVTVRKEVLQRPNEIERVALPQYVSSMSYDTDDDDIDTAIHDAIQHRATARPRYLPELASLDAGQMGSLVDAHPEVQTKREDESVELALEANDAPEICTELAHRSDAAKDTNLVGKSQVETELADTSVSFGNRTLTGGSDIDAELSDQPVTANVPAAAELQETDGRTTDTTEMLSKPEIKTELTNTSIPFEDKHIVGDYAIDAVLFDQPVTANVVAAADIQEADRRIGDTVADSHRASEEQFATQASSNGRARTTDPETSKVVSHKRASSITLALLDTAAQKRWRYDSYTFGPSSC